MQFVIPLPDHPYYLWQMLVQVTHFREQGLEQDAHYLVLYFHDQPSAVLRSFFDSPDLECYIHAYPDRRADTSYRGSMKPWLMARYYEQFPEQSAISHNYLDPDCIFSKPMDFGPYEHLGGVWPGSSTQRYTGADYIRSKGEQLFSDLCDIGGISVETALQHDANTTGAQYFVQGAGSDFWDDVEQTSVRAYRHMKETAELYIGSDGLPVQAWCAEMYMQQFATIRHGFTPFADPRLDFQWASGHIQDWDKYAYFHDAGVAEENGGYDFCKVSYPVSPFHKDLQVSPLSASARYVDLIKRTQEMFPGLIWE